MGSKIEAINGPKHKGFCPVTPVIIEMDGFLQNASRCAQNPMYILLNPYNENAR